MVFAPVHVWNSCLTGAVDYVGRLYFVENSIHFSLVLHADAGGVDVFALSVEEVDQMACDPAMFAPYQVFWLHLGDALEIDAYCMANPEEIRYL